MTDPIHIVDEGAGPATVLIHGVGLDLTMWEALLPTIRRGRRLVRYDMAGHGKSTRFQEPPSLDDFRDQLDEVIEWTGASTVSVVGFSMGAMVALSLAAARPQKVRQLVLLNSVFVRSDQERDAVRARLGQAESEGPSSLIDAALTRWFTPGIADRSPSAVEAVSERLRTNDARGFLDAYRVFATGDIGLRAAAGSIRCPTLIVTGAEDTGSTPAMTRDLARTISGAEARILPNLAHLSPIEGAPEIGVILNKYLKY